MDIDSEDQNFNQLEKLNEETEKDKTLTCTPKFIIFITVGNLIFIAICIVIIYVISFNKVDKISGFMNDYIKDLNKIAITEKRIKHLVKSDKEDKYQVLVDIQKLLFNFTWNRLSVYNETLVEKLDDKISKFLFPKDNKRYENITESLVKVLTQKEDYHIYQLLDESYLKTLMSNLEGNEKELNEKKLKAVILYALINLPMQIFYFSRKEHISSDYIESVIEMLKNNETENKINDSIENYGDSNDNIYMVLGCDQLYEKERIQAKGNYINLINTGLRIKSTNNETEKSIFTDNFKNYYINQDYKELMKQCAANKMDETTYKNFITECEQYASSPDITQNIADINKIFYNYNFSVETANTVINYRKLNVATDKIKIIQLGERYRNDIKNYNKENVFILYNVFDVSVSEKDNIKRATTAANAKAIKYLQDENRGFLTDEQLKNLILVSSKGDAERQLEAFNIISNLYNITIDFNRVIWNTESYTEGDIYSWVLEAIVKSYNLYCENYVSEKLEVNGDIYNFAKDILSLTETYKNP